MNAIDVLLVRYCPNGIHADLWDYTINALAQYPVNVLIRDNTADNIGLVKARLELLPLSTAPVIVLMDFDFTGIQINFPALAQRLTVNDVGMTIPCSHHRPNQLGEPLWNRYSSALPSSPMEWQTVGKVPCNCMVMKRSLFDALGGLYEGYHTAQADTELCYRIRRAGYRIEQHNLSKVMHIGGSSTSNPDKLEIWQRDRLTFESRRSSF